MPDACFDDHRLAQLYDPLHPNRDDLDAYASMVGEFDVASVLEIGCGTGTCACHLASRGVAVVIMTGNVAQVFLRDEEWTEVLRAARDSLRPGGVLVFETRDPSCEAWNEWTRQQSFTRTEVAGVGTVESWVEVLNVELPFVSFRWTYVFQESNERLTSDSTLRFRTKAEVGQSLLSSGFDLLSIRDAPDRPGREFVFIAQRTIDAT